MQVVVSEMPYRRERGFDVSLQVGKGIYWSLPCWSSIYMNKQKKVSSKTLSQR